MCCCSCLCSASCIWGSCKGLGGGSRGLAHGAWLVCVPRLLAQIPSYLQQGRRALALPQTLVKDNYIPVVASVASDGQGQALNVNADTAAGEVRLPTPRCACAAPVASACACQEWGP